MIKVVLIFISLFISEITLASALTDKISRASNSQIKTIAKSVAEALAKDTPTQIDNITKVTGVTFVSSTNTLIYHYEISEQPNSSYLRPRIITGVCTNEILRALLDKKIKFRYYYSAANGRHLLTLDVISRDCRNI